MAHANRALPTPSAQLTMPLNVTHAPTASTATLTPVTALPATQGISQSARTVMPVQQEPSLMEMACAKIAQALAPPVTQ